MKKDKELTAEQKKRIEIAWDAVLQINQRADERLAKNEAMGEMLVFVRKWVQPVVMDLSVGGIIMLEGSHREEATKQALDMLVRRWFTEQARHTLDFRLHRVIDDGLEFVTVYAVEHPSAWTWREKDRQVCAQIYGSLRTLDVVVDLVEQTCRTELELLRHDRPEAVREVRIFTADERKERIAKIKDHIAEFWFEGPHRPGRYPQLSLEDETARAVYHQELEVLDRRHRAEERRDGLVRAWENYAGQIRGGRQRDGRIEAEFVRVAGLEAPDMVETIERQITEWDKGK